MRWLLAVGLALVACGDDRAPGRADVLDAGPVRSTRATMTLTLAGAPALESGFLSSALVDDIDDTHYYDPRGDDLVS